MELMVPKWNQWFHFGFSRKYTKKTMGHPKTKNVDDFNGTKMEPKGSILNLVVVNE